MPSHDSITRTIRFCKEDVESIENTMKTEGITFNAAVHRLISAEKTEGGEVHPKNSEKSLASLNEIREMVEFSGLTVEKAYEDIAGFMNSGEIMLTSKGLEIGLPSWAEEISETCHDCGIGVEEAMSKAAKALRRGSL